MLYNRFISLFVVFTALHNIADAQVKKMQQGAIFKDGTDLRIAGIQILNKNNDHRSRSNLYGFFSVPSTTGDTLEFSSDDYQTTRYICTDLKDQIIYMKPITMLNEVVIKENSLKLDIKEVQQGYRKKAVFYTGTPHYYYLFVKPMTFIYENFKSEVIQARRYNRYARKEMAASKISERYNREIIKKVIPIPENQLDNFELTYMPTLVQLNAMNDYDLALYIRKSYQEYLKNPKKVQTDLVRKN